jgi:hypothetical protein
MYCDAVQRLGAYAGQPFCSLIAGQDLPVAYFMKQKSLLWEISSLYKAQRGIASVYPAVLFCFFVLNSFHMFLGNGHSIITECHT